MAKNIRPKNNQDAFNIALNGVRNQNYQLSFNKDGNCAYRGTGGVRCAIGHMIPNKLYKSGMESLTPQNSLFKNFPELGVYLEKVDTDLLTDLQGAHDNNLSENSYSNKERYETQMKTIALNWGLKYEPPK